MKDSRLGTYGALSLVMSVGLRWAALVALVENGDFVFPLIAAATLSRAAMIWPMALLPPARPGGLSSHTGRPNLKVTYIASILAVLITLMLGLGPALTAVLVSAFTTLVVMRLMVKRIGGQTGDTLGTTQQCVEIATLIILAMIVA